MKNILQVVYTLLLFFSVSSIAQTKKLDSIKTALNKHPLRDTVRLNLLVDYVLNAVNVNTSQALPLMQEVVSISKELNNKKGIEIGYIYLQLFYSDRGDFTQAMLYADTTIYYLEKDTNRFAKVNLGYLLNNIGGDNMKMGDYQKAIEDYTKAADLLEKYQPESLPSVYGGLAAVFQELQQLDKAYEYDKKAIAAAEKTEDKTSIARRYLNYAERLSTQKQYTSVEAILTKVKPIVTDTQDPISLAMYHQIQGALHLYRKQYKEAIPDFYAAYKIGLDNDDKYQQITLLDPLINALMDAGELNAARDLNDTLLKKSLQYQMNFGRKNAYGNSAKWYYLNKDLGNAYKFLQMKMLLSDSMASVEMKEKISMAETRYKVASKDREIQLLQNEKKLQQLQLRQKNTLNAILIGSAVVLLVISLLIYRNYKHRQKLQQQRINELETEKQLTATDAILKGEEKERSRLAQDLHDGLGGMLSGIKYSLNNMKENLIMTPVNAQAFEHSINMLDNSINEMRRVAHNMMPETLLKFGLDAAIRDFCSEMQVNGMLQVYYQSVGLKNKSINQSLSVAVYRVTQELLNNILKHAGATKAIVQLGATEKQLSITVEDNGKGVTDEAIKTAQGIGWKNIHSRVHYHKGSINIQSQPDKGTSIFIEFPLA